MCTWSLVAVVALTLGCHGDPLSDDGFIAGWANSASSLGVFTHAYEPLAAADGEVEFADSSCPQVDDDGTTVIITGGGCEDIEGDVVFGTATIERTGSGDRKVAMTGYGRSRGGGVAARVSGTVEVAELEPDLHAFAVDIGVSGGTNTEIAYDGTVRGGYEGRTVWNGAGTVSRDGVGIDPGHVAATTVDQLRDNDICPGESVSGTTTLVSDDHAVVITYDGATECDDEDAARWSRDGEDQGLVAGVVCAIGQPGARGRASGLAALVMAMLGVALLRRR